MNKAIAWVVLVLLGLSGCSKHKATPPQLDMEKAQHALALMQVPPVERSGRNMWAALFTLGQPNLTPEQRQALADDYTEAFNDWYTHDYVNWYLEQDVFAQSDLSAPSSEPPAPVFPREERPWIVNNPALCAITGLADCLSIVRQQPQATQEALAPYADVLEQIAALAEYDYYHMPLLRVAQTPVPPLRHLMLPRSAHALTYVKGNSHQALIGLCRDANTMRVLMRSENLIVLMSASSAFRGHLHVAAQIIAELPLDTALPAICETAFTPLTAEETQLNLLSAMRGEFASLYSFIQLEKKQIIHSQILQENTHVSDLDNVFLVDAQQKTAVYGGPHTQQALLKDEKFVVPTEAISTWPQQCLKYVSRIKDNSNIPYGIACALSQTVLDLDYAVDYVHRMQDMVAQLHMMQVLLWLRQQPNLPQPITSDYLQTAVPAGVYSSAARPLTVSEEGSELKIPAYEKRPRDPCACVRLPLPLALRHGGDNPITN